jgi:hypothetical protein
MMATYRFSGQAVLADDDILENATGGIFVDANGATIPIFNLTDDPISTITSNAFGQSSSFKANVPMGYIKFGEVLNRVFADEIAEFAVNAQDAVDTANEALATANAALAAVAGGGGGGGTVDLAALDLRYASRSTYEAAIAAKDAQITALQIAVSDLSATLAGKAATVHTHDASAITTGTLAVARLTPGVQLSFIWDDVGNVVKYNGTTITSRPAARNDLFGRLVGGAEADFPAWLNQDGDSQDVTQTA